MLARRAHSLVRIGSALGLVLVLAGCTKGGQFDPTDMFNSDMFDSKKKLQGQREPLFPNGVPGAETGVPQDLVKGYQPPPEPATDNAQNADATAAPAAEAAAKPKPKPKPKLARAPAQPHDAAFDQKASHPPTRISVGTAKPTVPPRSTESSQSVWPTPPPTAPAQQTAQPAQSIWPNPPATGTSSQ
jgi:hypothetical protein